MTAKPFSELNIYSMKKIRKNATYNHIKDEIITVLKQLAITTDNEIRKNLKSRLDNQFQ